MTKMLEKAARALAAYEYGDGNDEPWEPLVPVVRVILEALREPDEAMIAHVIQQVGDPSPAQWEIGERACALNGVASMLGDTVCAELARDWQAMIDTILGESQ